MSSGSKRMSFGDNVMIVRAKTMAFCNNMSFLFAAVDWRSVAVVSGVWCSGDAAAYRGRVNREKEKY